jgi:anti-sigma-K factor RskA
VQDIQHYIESGILELYALGELSPAERAEVEAQAARHPEVRLELNEALAAVGLYAEAHALTPPAGMRDRVLGHVMASLNASNDATGAAASVTPATSSLRAEVDAVAQARNTTDGSTSSGVRPIAAVPVAEPAGRSMWALAASVALLLSLVGNFVLYSRWQSASSDLVALQGDQTRIAATQASYQQQLGAVRQQNAILRSDEFRAVALAGTPAAPTAKARVLYNPGTRKVYVDVRSLPALPAGKQYQLWALDKGKPVDAGMLATGTAAGDSLQQMKDIAHAQAFAMTVEPTGGSVNPTMSTMTVIGNI